MPRISRFASRQCLGFLSVLTRGSTGAKPVGILGGGCTGNGLVGSGYIGIGTFSRLGGSSGTGATDAGGELGGNVSGSGEFASNAAVTGEEAAVPGLPEKCR